MTELTVVSDVLKPPGYPLYYNEVDITIFLDAGIPIPDIIRTVRRIRERFPDLSSDNSQTILGKMMFTMELMLTKYKTPSFIDLVIEHYTFAGLHSVVGQIVDDEVWTFKDVLTKIRWAHADLTERDNKVDLSNLSLSLIRELIPVPDEEDITASEQHIRKYLLTEIGESDNDNYQGKYPVELFNALQVNKKAMPKIVRCALNIIRRGKDAHLRTLVYSGANEDTIIPFMYNNKRITDIKEGAPNHVELHAAYITLTRRLVHIFNITYGIDTSAFLINPGSGAGTYHRLKFLYECDIEFVKHVLYHSSTHRLPNLNALECMELAYKNSPDDAIDFISFMCSDDASYLSNNSFRLMLDMLSIAGIAKYLTLLLADVGSDMPAEVIQSDTRHRLRFFHLVYCGIGNPYYNDISIMPKVNLIIANLSDEDIAIVYQILSTCTKRLTSLDHVDYNTFSRFDNNQRFISKLFCETCTVVRHDKRQVAV